MLAPRALLILATVAGCGNHVTGSTVIDCDPNDPSCNSSGGEVRGFPRSSLIIPMDLSYQSVGMFQAYGLVYQLLRGGVHVYWIIDPTKTYHAAACNTPGDLCTWDCGIEGSGTKCEYPTASPDVTATTRVIWDDTGKAARGSTLHDIRMAAIWLAYQAARDGVREW